PISFFFQAEDGIRDFHVTGVQTCALPILAHLTVDAHGVRGDEPGFDASDVAVYGLGINPNFEETGQMQWANFTGTLDWDYLDERSEERRVGKEGGSRGAAER